jgi:hypothetical protein
MKIAIPYCIICFVLNASQISSQSTFIHSYQYKPTYATLFNGILNQSDTLIISGLSYECLDSSTCYQGFYIAKVDTFGHIIKDTVILAPDDDVVVENIPILCATPDHGYMLVGELYSRGNGFMVKLNNDFEVEFSEEFIESFTGIRAVFNRGILYLKGHYYILSMKDHFNYQSVAHLIKIDSLGNVVWEKEFNKEGNASLTFKLSEDGNIMLLGQRGKLNAEDKVDIKQWCFFVDTAGTILHEYESEWMTDKLSGFFNIIELDEGYLISMSNYIYEPQISPYPRNQIVLQKANKDFVPEWTINYGDTTTINSIRNIIPIGDGDYIATGNLAQYPDRLVNSAITTLTMKFNESGEILWERLDSILYEPMYGSRNTTAETIVLNSGSIITTGYTDVVIPSQGTWGILVKLDENGCLLSDCPLQVGIDQEPLPNEILKIYPNPVDDELWISVENWIEHNEQSWFSISNELGINLMASDLELIDGKAQIRLSSLPAGIYFLQIEIGGSFYIRKFVKL